MIRARFLHLHLAGLMASLFALSLGHDASGQTRPLALPAQPLRFEDRSSGNESRFLARGRGYSLQLTADESILTFSAGSNDKGSNQPHSSSLHLRLMDSSKVTSLRSETLLPGVVNRYIGRDPGAWRTGIATWGRVVREGVYPGIDLAYYGREGTLEYDFVVAPKADPSRIRLRFEGARDLHLDSKGRIVVEVGGGEVIHHAPVLYQRIDGTRRPVTGAFRLRGSDVTFDVGEYNHDYELVIDPTLTYSTYLGGMAFDETRGVAYAAGAIFLAGQTASPDIAGLFPRSETSWDAFVSKIDATTGSILYTTYIGGSSQESLGMYGGSNGGLALDPASNPLVAGNTMSNDFPVTGAPDPSSCAMNGLDDVFVARLDSATGALSASRCLGGSASDHARAVATSPDGSIYVAGDTGSFDFPVTPGAFQEVKLSATSGFVAKLDSGLSRTWATFLSGSIPWSGINGETTLRAIAIGPAGEVVVAGHTDMRDFPLAGPSALPGPSSPSGVVARFSSGGALTHSTYFGGDSAWWNAVVIDQSGFAYLGGSGSAGFPATRGYTTPSLSGFGMSDGIVAKLAPDLHTIWARYAGGDTGADEISALALDSGSGLIAVGSTFSVDFPTLGGLSNLPGGFGYSAVPNQAVANDVLVTRFDLASGAIVASGHFGGSGDESGSGLAVTDSGNLIVTGRTSSENFPTVNAPQPVLGGAGAGCGGPAGACSDGFVAALSAPYGSPMRPSLYLTSAPTSASYGTGATIQYSAQVANTSPQPMGRGVLTVDLPASVSVNFSSLSAGPSGVGQCVSTGSSSPFGPPAPSQLRCMLGHLDPSYPVTVNLVLGLNAGVTPDEIPLTFSAESDTSDAPVTQNVTTIISYNSNIQPEIGQAMATPNPVGAGAPVHFTAPFTNYGPDPAPNRELDFWPPYGTSLESATVDFPFAGTIACAPLPSGMISCPLGTIPSGALLTAHVSLIPSPVLIGQAVNLTFELRRTDGTFGGSGMTLSATVVEGDPVLTVAIAGNGSGSVASSLGEIHCPGLCSWAFPVGSTVTLTAAPAGSSTFSVWGGDCAGQTGPMCLVSMNSAKSVTALFDASASGPPVVDAGPDLAGPEGSTFILNGSFADAVTTDSHSASVNWGDASPPGGGPVNESSGNGTYTASHVYAHRGTFVATVQVCASRGVCATDNVTFVVANVPPVASDGSVATSEDVPVPVALGATDVGGDTLSFSIVNPPIHGVLSGTAPNLTYTPASDFHGDDLFRFTASDGADISSVATVSIHVNAVNDSPVAIDDIATVNEDTSVTVNVLDNDTDVDGDTLSPVLVAFPLHGVALLNGVAFTYTPEGDYNGPDEFTYRVSDGTALSGIASVSIAVAPVVDGPTAVNDAFSMVEDQTGSATVTDNDLNPDGLSASAVLVNQASHGTVELQPSGAFTYTPSPDYSGPDQFTYRLEGGGPPSNIATVTITVVDANDAPHAVDDAFPLAEDTSLTQNVLTNDTDPESELLRSFVWSLPSHGSVSMNTDGVFTYTPNANYYGSDSFQYLLTDARGAFAYGTVDLTISSINDAPVANWEEFEFDEDTVLHGSVLANDTDVEGSPLSAILVTPPQHGTINLLADGSFIYTPNPNYFGSDAAGYMVSDGQLLSNETAVGFTIRNAGDEPTAVNDAFSLEEDTAISQWVVLNDIDPDGIYNPGVFVALATDVAHGALSLHPDGSFTYVPSPNYQGPDSFSYRIHHGVFVSNVATVTLTVTPVNDPPTVVQEHFYNLPEDGISMGNVLVDDDDIDGDVITADLLQGPAHGTLNLNPNGAFTYKPDPNYNGSDSFIYRSVSGGLSYPLPSAAYFTVAPVNDAPVLGDLMPQTVTEGSSLTFALSASDAEGDAVTYSANGLPAGEWLDAQTGVFLYTPGPTVSTPGSNTVFDVTFRATDPSGAFTERTISITVIDAGAPAPVPVTVRTGDFKWQVYRGAGSHALFTTTNPRSGAGSLELSHDGTASATILTQEGFFGFGTWSQLEEASFDWSIDPANAVAAAPNVNIRVYPNGDPRGFYARWTGCSDGACDAPSGVWKTSNLFANLTISPDGPLTPASIAEIPADAPVMRIHLDSNNAGGQPWRGFVDNVRVKFAGSPARIYNFEPSTDTDGDGVLDWTDNCPAAANPDQADGNGDGEGDACVVSGATVQVVRPSSGTWNAWAPPGASVAISAAEPRSGSGSLELTGANWANSYFTHGIPLAANTTWSQLRALAFDWKTDPASGRALPPEIGFLIYPYNDNRSFELWWNTCGPCEDLPTGQWRRTSVLAGRLVIQDWSIGDGVDAPASIEDIPPDATVVELKIRGNQAKGASWRGFVDNVTLEFAGGTPITYNFEPDATASATLTPAALSLGAVALGETSAPKTITLTNTGVIPLHVNSVTITGSTDFAFNGCAGPLAPGASCALTLSFSPASLGAKAGTLVVSSDAAGSPLTAALTGTGLAPTTLTPATFNFGNQGLGMPDIPRAFVFKSNLSAPVSIASIALTQGGSDFGVDASACGSSLAAKASCTIHVTFQPSALGAQSATLRISSNAAGSPQTAALSGTGVQPLTLTSTSLTFSAEGLGSTSASKAVTLRNNTATDLTLSPLTITGSAAGDFAIPSTTCASTLPPYGTCAMGIVFSPTALGARDASVTFTSSASNSPHTLPLAGSGVAPVVLSPAVYNFGSEGVGSAATPKTFTLKNNTNSAVSITSASVTQGGSDFSADASACGPTVAPKTSCAIIVSFVPGSLGSRTASLVIETTAAGPPPDAALTGTGVVPVTLTPAMYNFGNQGIGMPDIPKIIVLKNNLSSPISISAASLTQSGSDFGVDASACGATLGAKGSCSIGVTFLPSALGTQSATLSVITNASGSPHTAALSGTGVQPITLSAAALSFGSEGLGSASTAKTTTVRTNTGSTLLLSSFAWSGATAGDFAISASTCGTSLDAYATCAVSVAFSPLALGARAATLTFTSSASNSPHSISMSGTGAPPVTLTPTNYNFGSRNVNTSSPAKTLTVKNNGSSPVAFIGVALSGSAAGDYSSTTTCVSPIAAKGTCTIDVVFTPGQIGSRPATLNLQTGASTSPHVATLSGSGS